MFFSGIHVYNGRDYSLELTISDLLFETSGPEILWNEHPDTENLKYRSEIWIPVKKKDE